MIELISKILKEEAENNRDLATHGGDSKACAYCTIDLHGDVPMVVFREPIPYEDDMQTDLGTLQDFIKQYKNITMTFRELKFKHKAGDDRAMRTAGHDFKNGYLMQVYLFEPSRLTKGSPGWNVRITNLEEQESIHHHAQSIAQINALLKEYSSK